ncbi:hypothetical protein OTU49_010136 [Cherax quadricarinatus]|uniref:RING-type domain-containing protein n=1 Tax=Cherax quadricarinatus TaxID=27406 RepID=A0AAW0WGK4_CHEQU|nr:cell growth regulator with RING finger domain protein 1-like isoform X2 [Cherax quadricarinatus]
MVTFTAVLMAAAELSSLFSIIGVLVCFAVMAIFIIRVQGGNVFGNSVVHFIPPPMAQVDFQKVPVPFSLELHKPKDASFADVQLKLRSEVSYALRSFWGVPSDHLHSLLLAPWSTFFMHMIEKPSIRAEVIDDVLRNDVTEENVCIKQVNLCPNSPPLSLGESPRKHYPLVVCMVRQDAPQHTDGSQVGALITIIHIKDSVCQIPSCILHQYLKQYSGQLTKLQVLYTQVSDSSPGGESKSTNSSDKVPRAEKVDETQEEEEIPEIPLEEACVICQTKRTTRALLPCRHVCVCDTCCGRLDNCPMCRARILAYFLIAPEDPASAHEEETTEILEPPSAWRRLHDAVMRMFVVQQQQ